MLKSLFLFICLFACVTTRAQLSQTAPDNTASAQWHGENYYGPVKHVASTWTKVRDTIRHTTNPTEHISFNKQGRVKESFWVNSVPDTILITKPTYNEYGQLILENVLKLNGTLNNLIINEFEEEGMVKSTEYSHSGDLSSVMEYEYRGDTIFTTKRYFNTGTRQLDNENTEKTVAIRKKGRTIQGQTTQNEVSVFNGANEYMEIDKFGNWITMKSTVRLLWAEKYMDEVIITTRKIDYFED